MGGPVPSFTQRGNGLDDPVIAQSNRRAFGPDQVQVDARTYQFKSDGDAFGVNETLRNVTKWDDTLSGTLVFHERLDGSIFVANGHQRTGLGSGCIDFRDAA